MATFFQLAESLGYPIRRRRSAGENRYQHYESKALDGIRGQIEDAVVRLAREAPELLPVFLWVIRESELCAEAVEGREPSGRELAELRERLGSWVVDDLSAEARKRFRRYVAGRSGLIPQGEE